MYRTTTAQVRNNVSDWSSLWLLRWWWSCLYRELAHVHTLICPHAHGSLPRSLALAPPLAPPALLAIQTPLHA